MLMCKYTQYGKIMVNNNNQKYVIYSPSAVQKSGGKVSANNYAKTIKEFCQHIHCEHNKNKIPLIITGSGISMVEGNKHKSIPSIHEMMNKLLDLIDKICKDTKSDILTNMIKEYKEASNPKNSMGRDNNDRVTEAQAKLLTYIQNAYLSNKIFFCDEKDRACLKEVWEEYLKWLINGEIPYRKLLNIQLYLKNPSLCIKTNVGFYIDRNCFKEVWEEYLKWLISGDNLYPGLREIESTDTHKTIATLYKEMDAVSITTNFDNLLKDAFKDTDIFFPLLDTDDFNRYFLNGTEANDVSQNKQMIEIQSRGDVFWTKCSGDRNRACQNKTHRCYIPQRNIENPANLLKCDRCESTTEIYFAFPGTKEKDHEMATVMGGVWKFIAFRISAVIVVGNSMDYDPVLLKFLQELLNRKSIPILYISRYHELKDHTEEVKQKQATKILFSKTTPNNWHWARCISIDEVLGYISEIYNSLSPNPTCKIENWKKLRDKFVETAASIMGDKSDEYILEAIKLIQSDRDIPKDIFSIVEKKTLTNLKFYSQLGLETYWLRKTDENNVTNHNRYKHSINVMIIASAVYLSAREYLSTRKELLFVQTAALLHDIGHLPFSHLIEEIFDEFGWIPDGESAPFDHEYYTKRKIHKLLASSSETSDLDAELTNILISSGYNEEDLINLINGEYGVGYLDAIINGPIDCDKIEYIFSDGCFVGKNHESLFKEFLTEYCSELKTNDNCFLTISGKSYKNALKLIELRSQMYYGVYLRPGLRYLESCCKLIIRIFIAYKCTEIGTKIDLSGLNKENSNINLSDTKIRFIVSWIEKIERENSSKKKKLDTSLFKLAQIGKIRKCLEEWKGIISLDLSNEINSTTSPFELYLIDKIRKCLEEWKGTISPDLSNEINSTTSSFELDQIDKMCKCLEALNGIISPDLSNEINSITSPLELALIKEMCKYLEEWKGIISSDLCQAIDFCKNMIECKSTNASNFPISDIEQKYVHQIKIVESHLNEKDLNKLMKTVYLRFPGIILIDYVKIKNPFSFSKSGKKHRRMDGTNESIESILISQDNAKNWKCFGDATDDIINQLNLPRDSYLNLYKITKDHYRYMLAEDFVIDQLRQFNIIEGV